MSDQISFIHAADLHLDSPFKGLAGVSESILAEIRESTFNALDALVESAINRQVDFVLISGDLFDNDHQTLKAQVKLRNAFETLEKHAISVFMSYGNHDHINGNKHPVTYPDNVYVFPDETVREKVFYRYNTPVAAIYGFSYENRAVTDNKSVDYDKTDPSIPYHIAMMHGSLSSDTEHDRYAPFTLNQLLEKGMDYWALGHIHQRSVLKQDPPVVYPGNTQGRNRKESGEKGCYYVEMSPAGSQLSFVPLQAVAFDHLYIDAAHAHDVFQLEKHIQDTLEQRSPQSNELIALTFYNAPDRLEHWEQEGRLRELIDLMCDTLSSHAPWQYIYTYDFRRPALNTDLHMGSHFAGEVMRQFDNVETAPLLRELYHHQKARKFLDPLDAATEADIKEKAKQLIAQELFPEGGMQHEDD